MNALNLFLYTLPFWVPGLAGVYLCVTRRSRISRLAGLLTLKPILATPIWLAILGSDLSPAIVKPIASVLPGMGLSLLIVVVYWRLLSDPNAGAARILLGLDCLRWLNSAALAFSSGGYLFALTPSVVCIFAPLGLVLPTVFAVVALTLSLLVSREDQLQGVA
jgi:hypothetical protein